ncbi:MAG: hypothetical protein HY646_03715 [Acidobacteria bacterium]|nr:hypothetical protein [Acidobacteriota bacterium]
MLQFLLILWLVTPPEIGFAQRGGLGAGMRRQARRVKAVYLHDYRQALPKFDAVVKQLETALGQEPVKLSKLGKEMEKHTEVFLRYVKFVNEDHPKFEPADLQKYTNTELGWETLTSAERLAPVLPRVPDVENSVVVPIELWELLYALEGELQRLKWMASRLK